MKKKEVARSHFTHICVVIDIISGYITFSFLSMHKFGVKYGQGLGKKKYKWKLIWSGVIRLHISKGVEMVRK